MPDTLIMIRCGTFDKNFEDCMIFVLPMLSFDFKMYYFVLSYDVAAGSEITLYIKIDKPQAVYRCSCNIMIRHLRHAYAKS